MLLSGGRQSAHCPELNRKARIAATDARVRVHARIGPGDQDTPTTAIGKGAAVSLSVNIDVSSTKDEGRMRSLHQLFDGSVSCCVIFSAWAGLLAVKMMQEVSHCRIFDAPLLKKMPSLRDTDLVQPSNLLRREHRKGCDGRLHLVLSGELDQSS